MESGANRNVNLFYCGWSWIIPVRPTKLYTKHIACEGQYPSLDMAEIFFMEEDAKKYFHEIKNTLKLFDKQSPENITSLLRPSCVEAYDLEIHDYTPNNDYGYEYRAIGLST